MDPINEMKYSSSISSHHHQKPFPFISSTMHSAELIPNLSNTNPNKPNNTDYTNLIFSNNNINPGSLFSLTTPSVLPAHTTGTFDDPNNVAGDQIQVGVVNDRRLRRMISNRESARRSRLRKKKQIEELQFQVDHLRTANNHLSEKLIALLESNHEILQENAQLKEKLSSLQVIVSDLISPFRNVPEDLSNYVDHPKIATPSRSSRPV